MTKARGFVSEDKNKSFVDWDLLKQILKFAYPYRMKLWIAFGTLLLAQFLPFFFPHILGKLIDGPIREGDLSAAWPYLGVYLLLVIMQAGLSFSSSLYTRVMAFDIVHDLRSALFKRIFELKLPFFHKNPVGRLMTRVTSDVDALLSLFSDGLLDLLGMIIMLFFAIIFMFAKNTTLALATLAVMPPMVALTMIFRVKVRDINRDIRKHLAHFNSILQENLNGIRIVQLFFKQKERMEHFGSSNAAYRDAYLKNVSYYSWFFPGMNGLSDLSLALCYLLGAYLISQGQTGVGELVAFAWYATMFHRPLREISDKITQLQTSMAAGERVFTLLKTDEELESDGSVSLAQGPLCVDFSQVQFYYREDQPVLRGIDLHIRAGETLAIVGPTGAGKSTLFHLLSRFYVAQSGNVLIGNVSVEQILNADLRSRVALVSQDVFLFEDSLLNNLLMGESLDQVKLDQAISHSRLSQVLDKFPQGLQFKIEEGGKNLSAGQRQLISFARALYRSPDLLLLDEATSAIDSETEALIQEALPELLQGRTAVIIAHRLSTVVGADRIAVLHHGKVAELGNHQELLAQNGLYAKLVEMNKKSTHGTLQGVMNQL